MSSSAEVYNLVNYEISRLSERVGVQKSEVRRRKELVNEIGRFELELKEKAQILQKAFINLQTFLGSFNWPVGIEPLLLLRLSRVAKRYNECSTEHFQITQEINFKQSIISAFTNELAELATKLLPTADFRYPDLVVDELAKLKDEHLGYSMLTEKLSKNLYEAQKKSEELEELQRMLNAKTLQMLNFAHMEVFEDIEAKIIASQASIALLEKLESLTKSLKPTAGDQPLPVFIEATLAYSNEPHDHKMQNLEQQQHALDTERDKILQEIHKLDLERRDFETKGEAAAIGQSVENSRTEAALLIPEYLTRLFATRLLKLVADRLTTEQEPPVLKRASYHFANLTSGSFSKIAVDKSEDGTEAIVGIRNTDGSLVHPKIMSDGTCDQLYLSLRLAALEEHFRENRPLPVFFDDAFITFDGQRLEAAVKTLVELGKVTQVVYFTHDAGMREIGERLGVRVVRL